MSASRVLVLAGSARSQSLNRQLARLAADAAREAGAEVTLLSLGDYPLPTYDGDLEAAEGLPANVRLLKEMLRSHDALIVASPEHNGSIPAMLKSMIDWTTRPEPGERPTANYRGKAAALVSASPGPGGGQRSLRHLRDILEGIGVRVVPTQVSVGGTDLEALATPSDELRGRLRDLVADLMSAREPAAA